MTIHGLDSIENAYVSESTENVYFFYSKKDNMVRAEGGNSPLTRNTSFRGRGDISPASTEFPSPIKD